MKSPLFRTETDGMGDVNVPKDRYWGAQTQRSLENFCIGNKKLPLEIIYAHAITKKSAALSNAKLGVLEKKKAKDIERICDEILVGKLDTEFPLVIFQTGSGTQSNMNVNEVIANRAHVLHGGKLTDTQKILHPNDDVNKSQSTNDTFPTSLHIATYTLLEEQTLPHLKTLQQAFKKKAQTYKKTIKMGRTHCMDATPITLGQVFSSYASQIQSAIEEITHSLIHLRELPIGGTAVGTGINTPKGYAKLAVEYIKKHTGYPFLPAKNTFGEMAGKDALAGVSAALKLTAIALMKIGNDIRLLGSGPRCGIGEIVLPANEPGSSIMPGKVNPTQCEALTQVCAQVIGNDAAITIGAMSGQFELNVFMPMIGTNVIESARLIGDITHSFTRNCVIGIEANEERIQQNVENSLMLVTALNPHIGYENAAKIAKKAYQENTTLKQAAVELKLLTAEKLLRLQQLGLHFSEKKQRLRKKK